MALTYLFCFLAGGLLIALAIASDPLPSTSR
jgi:hypothetical protein